MVVIETLSQIAELNSHAMTVVQSDNTISSHINDSEFLSSRYSFYVFLEHFCIDKR